MAEIELTIEAGADDSFGSTAKGGYFSSNDTALPPFLFLGEGETNKVLLRFDGVSIPYLASVTNAELHLVLTSVTAVAADVDIYVASTPDISAPTNWSEFNSISLNETPVAWSITTPTGEGHSGEIDESPDISNLIQEIINNSSWTSGASITLVLDMADLRAWASYENTTYDPPKLLITYEDTVSVDTPEISNLVNISASVTSIITTSLSITKRGFVYSKETMTIEESDTPTDLGDFTEEDGSFSNGVYTLNLSDLDEQTEYFIRAYFYDGASYYYSDETTFTTLQATTSASVTNLQTTPTGVTNLQTTPTGVTNQTLSIYLS